jgi:hypothetical protein
MQITADIFEAYLNCPTKAFLRAHNEAGTGNAYAALRNVMQGTSTREGTEEYLVLLSICETCEYQGLDFLNFLRSGEKDIEVFAQSKFTLNYSKESAHTGHGF